MTQGDEPTVDPTTGVVRTRVRRSRPASGSGSGSRGGSGRGTGRSRGQRPPATGGNRALLVVGIVLILAGVGVLSWVGWEFWGTNAVSHHRQAEISHDVEKGWHKGDDTVHTRFGDASAVLHVPRFGEDYGVPVLEGDSEKVLAAGIAHFPHTAGPGQVGNYALAAHRVTHGEPFAKFPHLRKGDKVYVETRTATYEYVLDDDGTDLVVPMTDTWVIDKSPVNPHGGIEPVASSNRLITLVTCSEIFHTDNRSVVFGHFVRKIPNPHPGTPQVPLGRVGGGTGPSLWWWIAGAVVIAGCLTYLLRRRRR